MEVKIEEPFRFFELPLQLQYEYMLKMDLKSIQNVCLAAEKSRNRGAVAFFGEICNNQGFWLEKYKRDFPEIEILGNGEENWKTEYMETLEEEFVDAVGEGDVNRWKYLIRLGIDVNAPLFEDGDTALHHALVFELTRLVPILLEAGADVQARNEDGLTPLHYGISDRETLQEFLKRGADLNARDTQGRTPLYHAVENQEAETIQLLIQAGADVDAETIDGWTPIMLAVWQGNQEAEETLLEARARLSLEEEEAASQGRVLMELDPHSGAEYFLSIH